MLFEAPSVEEHALLAELVSLIAILLNQIRKKALLMPLALNFPLNPGVHTRRKARFHTPRREHKSSSPVGVRRFS
jgi:hypothetical protein